MSVSKEINKGITKSVILLGMGLIALFLGQVLNFNRDLMNSIALGFIPLSIGMALMYLYSKKNPKLSKNIELERDERNLFINTKAGYTAFWISYGYIFIVKIFGNLFNLTFDQFLTFTLVLMPIILLFITFIYHKKY